MNGFQCFETPPDREFFMPIAQGGYLICSSLLNIEALMKACKQTGALPIPTCQLDASLNFFNCKDLLGQAFKVGLDVADKYFCASPQDKQRYLDTCVSGK